MDSNEAIDYRRALEALRNGVPNREAVGLLGCNQHAAEGAFQEMLSGVPALMPEGKQAPGILIAGGFGAGKSHLLDCFEQLALSQNFVCSRVVVSKETPLFDAAKMYAAAADAASVPELRGEALREVAQRLDPKSARYAEFSQWANGTSSRLNRVFPATVLLYERLGNDPELVDQIIDFWLGERLSVAPVRRALKQIDSLAAYSFKAPKIKELAIQRFHFTSRMITAAGYSGWVLLIDEVELIGRYSLLQRGRSYAELARWMGRIKGDVCPGLATVAAITDDFGLAVLQEKSDRDIVGTRLRAKDTDEYRAIASRAETGMRLLQRDGIDLKAPDDATLLRTYHLLKEIHAKAYDWTPPEIPTAEMSATRRMRSYVRRWINEWDLMRLYPGAEVRLEDEGELKPTYEQDEALEQASESLAENS